MAKTEQWQLSAEAAELYERYVARYILAPWVPVVIDAAQVGRGERVLDVACGTGVIARAAMKRVGPGGRVVGLDLNPGMIAVARSLSLPGDLAIEWIEASALKLPLPDASMDVVLCQQGLQFFPDKALAMREMRRVLAAGGRLALSVWNGVGLYNRAVGEALGRFIGSAAAAQFCASRRVPSKEELRRLASEAGFSAVDIRVSRMDARLPGLERFVLEHLSATPVAPAIAAADRASREKLAARVAQQLQRFIDGDGVSYPEETHLLTAKAA